MKQNEPGNAGRSQLMQDLGGHINCSCPYPKSNGNPLRMARGDYDFEKINSLQGRKMDKLKRL